MDTSDLIAALELAADHIKDLDGGDMTTETGWKSQDSLDVWLKVRAAIEVVGDRDTRAASTARA